MTNNQKERANFGSKIGVILATAGSAVGLGNVWRFPYMTGENGGAVFIIIYIACVLLLGIPCMVSEFIIGRHGQSNSPRSYRLLANGTLWGLVGYMGLLTGFLIMGYYVVVSGWCLQYVWASLTGNMMGDPDYFNTYYTNFVSHPFKPILWVVVILGMTHLIIEHGIRNGIERASKVMMPVLFILLLIIVVAACMLPHADKGIEFLFKPDFTKFNGSVFLGAMGQSFYSLSIGMGALVTYASYFSKSTNLTKSAVQIVSIDSMVAILAGLMIFPAAFSVGISPDSGPSLIFITLPNVFAQAFAAFPVTGYIVSLLFFVLLSVAALTSLMSLHEVCTAFFQEDMHTSRRGAAIVVTTLTAIIGTFCSLSFGAASEELTFFGRSLFGWFDFLTGQILLPLGGFLTCLFIGWFVPHKVVRDEFTNWGELSGRFFHLFIFLIRYICPFAILCIFLHEMGVI